MKPPPPKLPLRFFRWFCHPKLRDSIEGDLMELYEERVREGGKRKADLKFVRDVLLLFRPSIIRPIEGYQNLNNYGMIKSYFTIGWRNILKYKVFSFINVFGLAVAMSVCMLIILMLADQRRYDAFHLKKDRIYRILSNTYATTPYPLASALKAEYPIIEETVNLTPGPSGDVMYLQKIAEMRGYFADPAFFTVFSFDLAKGDKRTALSKPYSMVISSELAHQLFGDEDPIGKTVEFVDRQLSFPQEFTGSGAPPVSWGSFTITGVINERKYKSHLKFDVLVSASTRPSLITEKKLEDQTNNWESYFRTYTYVLLQEDKESKDLAQALNNLVAQKYANIHSEQTKDFKLHAQKLGDVQLGLAGNDTNTRLPLFGYYFLAGLAFLVMISACLNYTNLSVARALTRAKEIGVRKVTGALRKDLVFQFLSESIITSLLALAMAILLLLFIEPAFKGLWLNKHLNFELPAMPSVYLVFTGFALLIGVVAGIYPALHLSKYQPLKAIKNLSSASIGKLGLRKALSVSQFVISLFFITTSILIYNQFKHLISFDYGFRFENIVNIELQGNDYQKMSNELQGIQGVTAISASDLIPSTGTNNNNQIRKSGSEGEYKEIGILLTNENFAANLGIGLIAGRYLPPDGKSSDRFILVNEATVKSLGYKFPSEMIGEVLETKWGNEPLEVIGVVKDFRYKSLVNEEKIAPLIMRNQPAHFEYLNVQLSTTDIMSTLANLESQWKKIDPVHPFKYEFFDEQLESTHRLIFDVATILGFVAFLAIVIACLGLLGMAIYTAERKSKEVGIRKVLGANELSIAYLLSKGFLKLLTVSLAIGAPLSYFINNLWLQKIPNRVEFGLGTVLLGTSVLLVLGLLTIGSQTIRASRNNPIESLKAE
jgi:putative ABC transport system permease protein